MCDCLYLTSGIETHSVSLSSYKLIEISHRLCVCVCVTGGNLLIQICLRERGIEKEIHTEREGEREGREGGRDSKCKYTHARQHAHSNPTLSLCVLRDDQGVCTVQLATAQSKLRSLTEREVVMLSQVKTLTDEKKVCTLSLTHYTHNIFLHTRQERMIVRGGGRACNFA